MTSAEARRYLHNVFVGDGEGGYRLSISPILKIRSDERKINFRQVSAYADSSDSNWIARIASTLRH
jgi:hypothetical protein